jgi:hypothetical protein
MKQTQELLERSHQVLEQTGELIERTQPILEELRTFLTSLSDLRTDLQAQCQRIQHYLSGLETKTGLVTDADTPLPDINGSAEQNLNKPSNKIDSSNWEEEVPELPSMSVSLAEFQLPWESSRLSLFEATTSATPKAPEPVRPPSHPSVANERRAVIRRAGNPTSVAITIDDDVLAGWVVDRSQLGVGMLVDDALEKGTRVLIKPHAAPAHCPAVEGEIRHCQPEKGQYRVGCKFLSPLSWQHLRYFG